MRFFYSGAKSLNSSQTDISKSLGGFISSTSLPNGRLNNLFQDVSLVSLQEESSETKAIFLKNISNKIVQNIVLYFLYPSETISKLQVACVEPVNNEMELIRSAYDLPYEAEFFEPSAVFSFSVFTLVEDNFVASDSIKIENFTIPMSSAPSNAEFMQKAKTVFSNSEVYNFVQMNETQFKLEYKILGLYSNTPAIVVQNNAITATIFGGGVDNSVLIAEEMEPGASLGIWLSKTIIKQNAKNITERFEEFVENNYQPVESTSLEDIQLVIEYDFI